MYHETFALHMSSFHHYKGKRLFFFFLATATLAYFNVGAPYGTTNMQKKLDFCSRVLLHVVGYRSHILLDAGYQLLKIVFDLADEVRFHLHHTMPGRWIGRGVPIAWPPPSPDLTPLNFFQWGFMNSFVYQVNNDDLQFKARMRSNIAAVIHSILPNTWTGVGLPLHTCLAVGRDSVVGIPTRYRLDCPGIEFR